MFLSIQEYAIRLGEDDNEKGKFRSKVLKKNFEKIFKA